MGTVDKRLEPYWRHCILYRLHRSNSAKMWLQYEAAQYDMIDPLRRKAVRFAKIPMDDLPPELLNL